MSKTYALKFISGKYQGGEFPLRPGGEIVIGRSADLDMVLVEDMVSRRHARIVVSGDSVSLADLGSTNGTFVNGQRITEAEIKEGDRILIGTSILKLVELQAGSRTMDADAMRQLESASAPRTSLGVMSGRIDEVSIPDLLQLFGASHKTGVLTVVSGGQKGKIHLRQGKIFYASIDDRHELGPEKSFYRIVAWTEGTFELGRPEESDFLVEMEESTESLLMEAMRQLDELKRLDGLPPRDANLALAVPLANPLRELEGDLLDVLQLALEQGTCGGVLDGAPGNDLDTAAQLVQLIERNYLRVG